MNKVLIIAHLTRASPRIPGLAKYLPEFGWQPTAVTASLDKKPDEQFRIVETEYRETLGFWKKVLKLNPSGDERIQIKERLGITSERTLIDFVLTRIGAIVNYPDSDKGWKPFATKAGEKLLREEKIDVIISSSSPVTSHIIANELKSRYGIPWLADLRDLWSQNHNYSYGSLRQWVDKRLELKTLATADALVTVSQPWAEKLSALHGGKKTYTITNGFDPEMVNILPENLMDKFTITYTGLVYPGKQDPTRFFAALHDLISSGVLNPNHIEVRFYGPTADWLDREIEQYRLSHVAKQYGLVSRDVALQKQRESQLLLLLNWDDPGEKGNYPGKVFEYLAARRPILAIGGSEGDVVGELLGETLSGIHAITVEDIKNALEKMYRQFQSEGRVASHGDNSKINKYSYREMAKKFAEILDKLAPGK